MLTEGPRIVVFTSVFPNAGQPRFGVFVRERMFRVGKKLPLVVVAPVPWFPFQGLLRRWCPHFRPPAPLKEVRDGVDIYHPRFFCVPGIFKSLDGIFMAVCSYPTLRRIRCHFKFDLIDSHFAYPDGYAATWLGRWLKVPVTITLRGTELRMGQCVLRRRLMLKAIERSTRVFSVADSLKKYISGIGGDGEKIRVVGNGVDTTTFYPEPQAIARERLGLPANVPVLISVGGLCERKGFHRVIELLPALRQHFPGLLYLIVGGASPEGDWTEQLHNQVDSLGLQDCVRFLGSLPHGDLRWPLSAADLFVLSTRNEGWANVFLEAMGCGLPVITTDVGGNREVVSSPSLGCIVPFGDPSALQNALEDALTGEWDRSEVIAWAKENSWDKRVAVLVDEFKRLTMTHSGSQEKD